MKNRGQRYLVFASRNDWESILTTLEQLLLVKYVESGMQAMDTRPEYPSFKDLPRFGHAILGDSVQEPRYLIMKNDAPLFYRRVELNSGEKRFVLDHGNNPESVIFAPGGLVQERRALIQGEISKSSTHATAELIFRSVAGLIKKQFVSVGAYRVGEDALSLKKEGYRLTAGINNPVEYDLH